MLVIKSRNSKIDDLKEKYNNLNKERLRIGRIMNDKKEAHKKRMEEKLRILDENKKYMTEICEKFTIILKEKKGENPKTNGEIFDLEKEMKEFKDLISKLDVKETVDVRNERVKEFDTK